ncbi:hypothetical protein PGTUg99_025666 [Puccinia graminis f. sp. tritici]|uniref:Chromo domain-containing protein n=1 Tax=Puccinia graminis f. sp. tritici TaxID=56615 RepID=A0A5B0R8P3_PUCGR|nr:hypothetical protein PGTUg99_025666 [Puccinia graminis f. sp. tritici]
MTTLATGLPISSRSAETKITPALRLAVQKATSVFQKDFCYDFIQALVDEPEIADPIGVRLFLNFCLRKPDNLVDSFLDSLDQNLGPAEGFSEAADTILNEIDNFIEFVHGLIEMIDGGEIFKLAYHEIDAWKLCYQLLEPIQHRLFDLAVQDRHHFQNHNRDSSASSEPFELTFASDSTTSGFYQAFVTIDKFLKHSFESRILLEPAKLVEDADQLAERRTELQTFRSLFPSTQNSTLLVKKHGRFGREEATIDQFLESDKFKELSKLKATMSGGQPTSKADSTTSSSKHRQGSAHLSQHGSTTSNLSHHPKRKRNSRGVTANQLDTTTTGNTTKTRKKRKSKSNKNADDDDDDDNPLGHEEELFVVDKIIGESVDINGETIYKVLWAGYPESEATWQFANTLDDCAALDVWQQNKKNEKMMKDSSTTTTKHKNNQEDDDGDGDGDGDDAGRKKKKIEDLSGSANDASETLNKTTASGNHLNTNKTILNNINNKGNGNGNLLDNPFDGFNDHLNQPLETPKNLSLNNSLT